LPQDYYEKSAVLDVTDLGSGTKADVVNRVFMLFRGVKEDELASWANCLSEDEVDWPEIVGTKMEGKDESLFRVLEWGGMEVV